MLRSERGAGMKRRCCSREVNRCDNLLLLFWMAATFALPFVHLFWICFEGLDPLLHWGNCSCFWRMQSLDDSLDFTVCLRPDCKPLHQIPGKKQQDFTGGTERALGCLPAYRSMLHFASTRNELVKESCRLGGTSGSPAPAQSRARFMRLCSWGLNIPGCRSLILSGV